MLAHSPNSEWYLATDEETWQEYRDRYLSRARRKKNQGGFWRKNRALLLLLGSVFLIFVLREGYSLLRERAHQTALAAEVHTTVEMETSALRNAPDIARSLIDSEIDERWQQKLMADRFPPRFDAGLAESGVNTSSAPAYVATRHPQLGTEDESAAGDPQPSGRLPWIVEIQKIEVREDRALVEVHLRKPGTSVDSPVYRTVRFYRRTVEGWKETAPIADFWGPLQTLETEHLLFHFRERDAEAVAAAAARLEKTYVEMRTSLGLTTPLAPEAVSVEVHPLNCLVSNAHLFLWDDALSSCSPALAIAPLELSEEEILYQAVAIQLAHRVVNQTTQSLRSAAYEYELWWPFVSGLRLWLIWDAGGALADLQPDMLAWLYTGRATFFVPHTPNRLEVYGQICERFDIWNLAPEAIGIPIDCNNVHRYDWRLALPLLSLPKLGGPLVNVYDPMYRNQTDPGTSIAIAIQLEYVVEVHGREQLRALLTQSGKLVSWYWLIPAVFEMSMEEFEAGWHTYLCDTYDVKIHD